MDLRSQLNTFFVPITIGAYNKLNLIESKMNQFFIIPIMRQTKWKGI